MKSKELKPHSSQIVACVNLYFPSFIDYESVYMIVIKTAKTDKDINIQSFQLFSEYLKLFSVKNWFLDFYIIIFKRRVTVKSYITVYNPYE